MRSRLPGAAGNPDVGRMENQHREQAGTGGVSFCSSSRPVPSSSHCIANLPNERAEGAQKSKCKLGEGKGGTNRHDTALRRCGAALEAPPCHHYLPDPQELL